MKTAYISFLFLFVSNYLYSQTTCTPNPIVVENNFIGPHSCSYNFCFKWLNLNQHENCDNWDGWILVEKEEFNENTLDLQKWGNRPLGNTVNYWGGDLSIWAPEYPMGFTHNTNGTLSLTTGYTPPNFYGVVENIDIQNGITNEKIEKDGLPNYRKFDYLSAQLVTRNRFPKGKWQMKGKIPSNDFSWPAFWQVYQSYNRQCYTEVDGFEFYRQDTKVAGKYTECFHDTYNSCPRFTLDANKDNGTARGKHGMKYNCPINFSSDFHTYEYEWDPQKLIWSIDGDIKRKLYKWIGIGGLHQHNPCSKIKDPGVHKEVQIMPRAVNMPLLLGSNLHKLACDNGYPGTPFPDNFDLDYVRYYMRIDCSKTLALTSYNPDGSPTESPTCYAAGKINVAGNGTQVQVPGFYTNTHTITHDWSYNQFLSLVAADEINLYDGFDTEYDATFNAVIRPCSEVVPGLVAASYDSSKSVNINEDEIGYAFIPKGPEDSVIGDWASDTVEIEDNIDTLESNVDYKTDGSETTPNNTVNKVLKPEEVMEKGGFEIAPNPANNNVVITYLLPSDDNLTISIYDIRGTKVQNLTNGFQYGGTGELNFSVANLPQGVYVVDMESKFGVQRSKLVVTH